MKIVSFVICPFVQRITALLEAKAATYEVEYISLKDKPQWFLDISPHGQVPLLITDDKRALFESDAIAEYIEETVKPSLLPTDPVDKAHMRAWIYLATKNYLVQCGAQRSPDEQVFSERSARFLAALAKMNKYAEENGLAEKDSLTALDAAWLPILHRAGIVKQYSGFDYLQDFPALQAWQKKLMTSGIAEKSVADNFNEKFNAFYLSDETYLGRMPSVA